MNAGLYTTGVVALVAIVGATVALCLGHIDGGTFAGIVGGLGGAGAGAGAHAAGTRANQTSP